MEEIDEVASNASHDSGDLGEGMEPSNGSAVGSCDKNVDPYRNQDVPPIASTSHAHHVNDNNRSDPGGALQ
jgi:hypothetical protein